MDGNIFKAEAAKIPIIIIMSSLLNFRIINNWKTPINTNIPINSIGFTYLRLSLATPSDDE